MIENLSRQQLERAMYVVGELAQLQDLRAYPREAVGLVRSLIPCDHAAYNVVDLRSRRATVVADPTDCMWEGAAEDFARLGDQNPMLAHVARTQDRRALVLSDFITQQAFHRTELYASVYRRIPMEYQLAISLGSPTTTVADSAEVVGLSLGRIRRDFGRAEARLLEVLQPHFSSALGRLHEAALLRATLAADPQQSSRWLLLIDREGSIAWASPAAGAGLGVKLGDPLPDAMRGWFGSPRQHRAATVTLGEVPLRVRLVTDAYPGLDMVHLTPLTGGVAPEALRLLGLTGRQADVLGAALHGRTAGEIAAELGLSRRTVEKHFEAIYARLGASNRAEAIITALRELDR